MYIRSTLRQVRGARVLSTPVTHGLCNTHFCRTAYSTVTEKPLLAREIPEECSAIARCSRGGELCTCLTR